MSLAIRHGVALLTIALLSCCVPVSLAAYVVSVQQIGSNLVATGTYEWTWGTGPDADSFTVQIGSAVVSAPLPAGAWAALLAIPIALIARKRVLAA